MKILILGAGVIGLTTALELSELGHEVEIWAEKLSPHTTSDVAAAFWYPFAAYPIDLVSKWARISFEKFKGLGDAGVRTRLLVELYREKTVRPEWHDIVDCYTELQPDSEVLPTGFRAGFTFKTFVIDTSIYMPFLVRKCHEAAVTVRTKSLTSLSGVPNHFGALINCTGYGARQLCGDDELTCARGQVIRIPKPLTNGHTFEQPIMLFYEDDAEHFAMIVPRINDTVLGGTFELGNSNLQPDQDESPKILERCREIAPDLVNNETPNTILGTACGLRPVRASVRLEIEEGKFGLPIIHNYGHGGAGVTLSWGCAQEVAQLLGSLTD